MNGPKDKVFELMDVLKGAKTALITTHKNPDPDALGSAFGMRHLLTKTTKIRSVIGYSGFIGRSENQIMTRLLHINPIHLSKLQSRKFDRIILCDYQPRGKTQEVFKNQEADIVLDHHPSFRRKSKARFSDIRTDYGATSTIVTEFLQRLEVPLSALVATALFYGIKTDISDIARHKNEADIKAMRTLFPRISMRWLARIESPRVPADYFQTICQAVQNARIHKDAIVTCLGEMPQADYVAILADYLLKLEGMRWSFCVGCVNDEVVFSIRSLSRKKEAGRIAQKLAKRQNGSGGGHQMSAAGRTMVTGLDLNDRLKLCMHTIDLFLNMIGRDAASGKKIVIDPIEQLPPAIKAVEPIKT